MDTCPTCRELGSIAPGTTTLLLERGRSIVGIRGVPARVCRRCGHSLLEADVKARTQAIADSIFAAEVEVAVRDYDEA